MKNEPEEVRGTKIKALKIGKLIVTGSRIVDPDANNRVRALFENPEVYKLLPGFNLEEDNKKYKHFTPAYPHIIPEDYIFKPLPDKEDKI